MTPLDLLYPAPRQRTIMPNGGPLRGVRRVPVRRSADGRPGVYSICFDGTALTATASDGDGEHSARSMLGQLAASEGVACPAFELHDWPRFATRGLMLDVSRNRVPKMDTLRELIDTLSLLRMNHLQLYTEHTFAYRGHEAVWQGASPITPDEVRELDRLCTERGITLAANQNCFGHLAEWLQHPSYAELAETHGPYDFYGIMRDGPFSLCPVDERSLALVRDWIGQLRACFASPLLNIGCDETADVGTGRSRRAIAEQGKAGVYAVFVSAVAQIAEEHGFEPMFWADIALGAPGTLELLPASLKPLAWGYEPDSPFANWNAALVAAGRTGWVCPGTSCWRSFAGRTTERRATLEAACADHEAFDGILVTAWGDVGHQQQWPVTLHAIADAAHAAWHGTASPDPAIASRCVFGSPQVGPWLDALGDADQLLRSAAGDPSTASEPLVLRNASATFNELHPANPALPPRGTLKQWAECDDRLSELESACPSPGGQVEDELRWTVDMSRLACRIAHARRSGERDDSLSSAVSSAACRYRTLWHHRSRPGGLDRSVSHVEGLTSLVEGAAR